MFLRIKGVHPPENKLTAKSGISPSGPPSKVIIPLQQHIGCIAKPVVKAGDDVKKYQKVGEAAGNVCANIHASVSGQVVDILPHRHPCGGEIESVVIESDGKDEALELKKTDSPSAGQIKEIIKEAGIVGMGGAMFPTHVKLSSPKPIDTVILNGAECEPYITSDNRVMIEHSQDVVKGLKLIMKCVNAKHAFIAIEDNKKDAIAEMQKAAASEKSIGVKVLRTSYPQGAEKTTIYNVLGRTVPSGGLPPDVGVLVNNVGTAKAICDAVYGGKPLVERVITVTGDVNHPLNLLVRIGTPVKDLIAQCKGYKGTPKKILMGGPMMGIPLPSDDVPVVKGTNAIVVIAHPEKNEREACIRCAKCVDVCPVFLSPKSIAAYADKGMIDEAEKYFPMDCIECGACAYICPAKIPLVDLIKKAKGEIKGKRCS